MGQIIHRIIRQESGHDDPYRSEKIRLNRMAGDAYEHLKLEVSRSPRAKDLALRLAVAGNVIDFGPPDNGNSFQMGEISEAAKQEALAIDDGSLFWRAVDRAEHILYLGDNAGEVYFDRLLIERLPVEKVTFVVRGNPIINDLTLNDLNGCGLGEMVEVIDNGSDAPGTSREDCSDEFHERFAAADVVISKGQGNYETLSGVKDKRIFYLLKAKCPVLARDLGVPQDSLIVKGGRPAPGWS
jgi:uncharacterized protein with ATP-grasp and redox domains